MTILLMTSAVYATPLNNKEHRKYLHTMTVWNWEYMKFHALFRAWYAVVHATSGTMALPACMLVSIIGTACVWVCMRAWCLRHWAKESNWSLAAERVAPADRPGDETVHSEPSHRQRPAGTPGAAAEEEIHSLNIMLTADWLLRPKLRFLSKSMRLCNLSFLHLSGLFWPNLSPYNISFHLLKIRPYGFM